MHNKNIKYILIANGNKALIYRSLGNIHNIELIEKFTSDSSHLQSHDLGRDKPGRGKEGLNGSMKHSTDSKTDPHKKEKHNFLVEVAHYLNREANSNAYAHLIIAASPEALGEIRNELDKTSKALIMLEINKDLTHVVAQDIPVHIEKHMVA